MSAYNFRCEYLVFFVQTVYRLMIYYPYQLLLTEYRINYTYNTLVSVIIVKVLYRISFIFQLFQFELFVDNLLWIYSVGSVLTRVLCFTFQDLANTRLQSIETSDIQEHRNTLTRWNEERQKNFDVAVEKVFDKWLN